MNIVLNLKSIVAFEIMTKKSFKKIDFNSEDVMKLLYCIVLKNNNEIFSYNDFLEIIKSEKILKEITDKFNKQLKLVEQFNSVVENEIKEEKEVEEKKEELFIKDIVSILIINAGIDANYIMNEVSLFELDFLLKTYNDKIKFELEQKRLWTYLSMLPHVADKSFNSPTKLFQFEWDVEEIEPEKNFEFSTEEMEKMMSYEYDFENNKLKR